MTNTSPTHTANTKTSIFRFTSTCTCIISATCLRVDSGSHTLLAKLRRLVLPNFPSDETVSSSLVQTLCRYKKLMFMSKILRVRHVQLSKAENSCMTVCCRGSSEWVVRRHFSMCCCTALQRENSNFQCESLAELRRDGRSPDDRSILADTLLHALCSQVLLRQD